MAPSLTDFMKSWPIVYPEQAYGLAATGQTIVNVTDTKIIKLYVDDEPFWLPHANIRSFDRRLNMKSGTLDREIVWETPAGKRVSIKSALARLLRTPSSRRHVLPGDAVECVRSNRAVV